MFKLLRRFHHIDINTKVLRFQREGFYIKQFSITNPPLHSRVEFDYVDQETQVALLHVDKSEKFPNIATVNVVYEKEPTELQRLHGHSPSIIKEKFLVDAYHFLFTKVYYRD